MLDAPTQQAFLQALTDHPEFRAAVRRQLLTSELLELPEGFAEYAVATERRLANLESTLARFLESTERRLAALEQGQEEIKTKLNGIDEQFISIDKLFDGIDGRFDGIKGRLDRMDRRMDNGFGTGYEIKVSNNFGSLAGRHLRLTRTKVLKAATTAIDDDLNDLIADAEKRDAITEEQVNEPLAVDLIASGRSRDGGGSYVAAEVFIAVGDRDIVRAAERAEYLAKAHGQAVTPAVVGESIAPEQEELAQQRNVTVMTLPLG